MEWMARILERIADRHIDWAERRANRAVETAGHWKVREVVVGDHMKPGDDFVIYVSNEWLTACPPLSSAAPPDFW